MHDLMTHRITRCPECHDLFCMDCFKGLCPRCFNPDDYDPCVVHDYEPDELGLDPEEEYDA